jgi:fatty-acyl-CoA synthase
MLPQWLDSIGHEYYGGTELNGTAYASPSDWLSHPGTVGMPVLGTLHICDEDRNERATGEDDVVYFERDALPFEYYKDLETTRGAQHPRLPTWTTLGDVGHLRADGFLYLTDCATFHDKCPRSIAFTSELPRQPTGKLYKRLLLDPYWLRQDTRIV